ncbi:MAG: hypothetical protein JXC36_07545 [Candidatus Atribacteria bacterium]|nr:hypothetical protein [Candidatus Atribacteria bacterium]
MDLQILKTVGQIAGLGGFAVGILFLLFKEVIKKNIYSKLTKQQSFILIRLFLVLVWSVTLFGIASWTSIIILEKGKLSNATSDSTSVIIKTSLIDKTFSFDKYYDPVLIKKIEENSDFIYNRFSPSTFQIRFTYSGKLRNALTEGYSLYTGGYLLIIINDAICYKATEIEIRRWGDEPGNPTDELIATLHEEIATKIIQNRDIIAQYILECLKDE